MLPDRFPLPMILAAYADDWTPCDECEDPESCAEDGECELGLKAAGTSMHIVEAAARIDIQAAADQPKKFGGTGYSGGPLFVAGFNLPVYVDLRGLRIVRQDNAALRAHKQDQAVGHTTLVAVSDNTLRFEGVVSCTGPHVDEVIDRNGKGFPWRPSIGVTIDKQPEFVSAGASATVNGRNVTGPVYIARKTTFQEISFVEVGGDAEAQITLAASAALSPVGASQMENTFEEWLAGRGHADISKLLPEVRTKLQASFDAEVKLLGGVQHTNNLDELAERLRKEFRHETLLQAKLGKHPDLITKAVTEKWDLGRIEAEASLIELRASRQTGAFVAAGVPDGGSMKVLEAALCLSAKLPEPEKHYEAKTLELADKHHRQMGVQELLLNAAAMNGYALRPGAHQCSSDLKNVLMAAFSTNAITDILSNIANKFLLQGYRAVDQTWRMISRIGPVKDFKTTTRYRMTGPGTWDLVGNGGQIKHGVLGQQSFTNAAKTYAKMLSIPRQDIINDDLSALSDAPRLLGRGAGLKLNDVFWTEFLDNASFFSSGNANYITGSTTNLTSTGLSALEKTFMNQTDPDGKPLGVRAKFLLTGTTLYRAALELMGASSFIAGGDTTIGKIPAANTFQGSYQPLATPYLENSSFTGFSTTQYFLLADPQDVPVIDTVFLDGNEVPTVEQADADFSTLGIEMRGFHDFGCSKQDYRGGAKSKGAA